MFSKTQSHWKDKADIAPTSPEPPPLWPLLWPPPIIHFWLLSFPGQTGYFYLYLGCKDLFVLFSTHVQIHCCLALVQEWMSNGRDTKFLPACPISLFFSTVMALIACAVSKNAILTAHFDHRWVFYFSKGLQNRDCGKLKLVWQCLKKKKKCGPLYCPSDIKS